MTAKLTKGDLRLIAEHLASLRPPGPRPLNAEQLVRLDDVIGKVQGLYASVRAAPERGEMVFEWRVPREWAPIKSGKGVRKWVLGKIKDQLGDAARQLLPSWPHADLCFARKRRWVQVRRYSDKKPDRPHCPDCLGARQAIDTLKDLGIIVDDNTEWTVDDSDWIQCKRGQTHVVVRVFEVTDAGNGRSWPEPECLPPPKPERKRGPIVASIVGAVEPKKRARRTTRTTRPRRSSTQAIRVAS